MATEKKSVFEVLNNINVNGHTEKKNNLTYLSWAWAWAEVKKAYPTAKYTVYENELGWNYFSDGKTCWVKTGVEIDGLEHIEYLPVMDFKNKSIPVENVTSFDVNKAIQRSLTKACARHGLGLYIYAGEDLPEDEAETKKTAADALAKTWEWAQKQMETISEEQIEFLKQLLHTNGINVDTVLSLYNVKSLEEITNKKYENIKKNIENIKRNRRKRNNEQCSVSWKAYKRS